MISPVDVNYDAVCAKVFILSRCLDGELGSTQTLETLKPASFLWVEVCWAHSCWKLSPPFLHFPTSLLLSSSSVTSSLSSNSLIIKILIICKHGEEEEGKKETLQMLKQCSYVTKKWLDNQELISNNKNPTLWFYLEIKWPQEQVTFWMVVANGTLMTPQLFWWNKVTLWLNQFKTSC